MISQVCGKGRAVLVDYILRVRWCKPCRELKCVLTVSTWARIPNLSLSQPTLRKEPAGPDRTPSSQNARVLSLHSQFVLLPRPLVLQLTVLSASGAGTYTTNLLSYFKPIVESVNARLLELWATHQTANASLDSAGERKETDYERFVSFRMPEAFSAMRKSVRFVSRSLWGDGC